MHCNLWYTQISSVCVFLFITVPTPKHFCMDFGRISLKSHSSYSATEFPIAIPRKWFLIGFENHYHSLGKLPKFDSQKSVGAREMSCVICSHHSEKKNITKLQYWVQLTVLIQLSPMLLKLGFWLYKLIISIFIYSEIFVYVW